MQVLLAALIKTLVELKCKNAKNTCSKIRAFADGYEISDIKAWAESVNASKTSTEPCLIKDGEPFESRKKYKRDVESSTRKNNNRSASSGKRKPPAWIPLETLLALQEKEVIKVTHLESVSVV